MTLYYNGVDITDAVEIVEATNTDACGGRCDCLDIAFAKPSQWYAWQPNTDDVIRLEHNGYDTGDMYVSAFFPEAGLFKITAFSIPQKARTRRWQAFRNMKLKDIVYACASECGMSYGLYGIDGNIRYPFILRRNEGAAAFLSRLCAYEGAVLKCVNGKIAVIGIEYAQKRDAIRGWELASDTDGVTYTRRSDNRVRCMTVRSPDGDAKALDVNAEKGIERIATAPASCAARARTSISATSSIGLVGLSSHSMLAGPDSAPASAPVPSRAASTWPVSAISTVRTLKRPLAASSAARSRDPW